MGNNREASRVEPVDAGQTARPEAGVVRLHQAIQPSLDVASVGALRTKTGAESEAGPRLEVCAPAG